MQSKSGVEIIDAAIKTKTDNIPANVVARTVATLDENVCLTLNNTQADKDFTATNTLALTGLPTTDDTKIVKVQLMINLRVENTYAGANYLDCSTATDNQWQMDLDNAGYADLVNGAKTTGQMKDSDWHMGAQNEVIGDQLIFDVTSQLTNIDGKIGIRLTNARAKQASLYVTASIYAIIDYKNV